MAATVGDVVATHVQELILYVEDCQLLQHAFLQGMFAAL
jgi:hypothetical protein